LSNLGYLTVNEHVCFMGAFCSIVVLAIPQWYVTAFAYRLLISVS